jgi:hypothetical protein
MRRPVLALVEEPLFPFGSVVVTPGALGMLTDEQLTVGLRRHGAMDWGNVSRSSRKLNFAGLKNGERVLSIYAFEGAPEDLWIVTEGVGEVRVTTLFLPSED